MQCHSERLWTRLLPQFLDSTYLLLIWGLCTLSATSGGRWPDHHALAKAFFLSIIGLWDVWLFNRRGQNVGIAQILLRCMSSYIGSRKWLRSASGQTKEVTLSIPKDLHLLLIGRRDIFVINIFLSFSSLQILWLQVFPHLLLIHIVVIKTHFLIILLLFPLFFIFAEDQRSVRIFLNLSFESNVYFFVFYFWCVVHVISNLIFIRYYCYRWD